MEQNFSLLSILFGELILKFDFRNRRRQIWGGVRRNFKAVQKGSGWQKEKANSLVKNLKALILNQKFD